MPSNKILAFVVKILDFVIRFFIFFAIRFGVVFLVIYGFILLVFSSSDTEIDFKIPQEIGGKLLVKGTETDYYEGCTYNINLSYQISKSDNIVLIGNISGDTRDRTICNEMGFYEPKSIYSDLQIIEVNNTYQLIFENGIKPITVFKSKNLSSW